MSSKSGALVLTNISDYKSKARFYWLNYGDRFWGISVFPDYPKYRLVLFSLFPFWSYPNNIPSIIPTKKPSFLDSFILYFTSGKKKIPAARHQVPIMRALFKYAFIAQSTASVTVLFWKWQVWPWIKLAVLQTKWRELKQRQ